MIQMWWTLKGNRIVGYEGISRKTLYVEEISGAKLRGKIRQRWRLAGDFMCTLWKEQNIGLNTESIIKFI